MGILFSEAVTDGVFTFSFLDSAVFAGFVLLVIIISVLMSRNAGKSSADYFLAGRGLQWWLIGFSLIAANISAEQFVGMSGSAAMCTGIAIASFEWIAAITLVGVAFLFLPMFLRCGIYTIPEFLEYRYNKLSRSLMSFSMMIILVGVCIATVIYLGALTINTLFGGWTILGFITVNIQTSAWFIGILASLYVYLGGLKACAWADLIQGSALILGGLVVMCYAFMAFGKMDVKQMGETPIYARPDAYMTGDNAKLADNLTQDMQIMEKFQKLNADKLHMIRPLSDPNIVWTTLFLGIWIPNFYYWGLNQYIMQRTLGSQSLAEGQKGIVFAAAMKLIIPFIVVIPGILAYNMYHKEMVAEAMSDQLNNAPIMVHYEAYTAARAGKELPETAVKSNIKKENLKPTLYPFNREFAALYPDLAKDITCTNAVTLGMNDFRENLYEKKLSEKREEVMKKLKITDEAKLTQHEQDQALQMLNSDLVKEGRKHNADQNKENDVQVKSELIGYKYDAAFPLLLKHLPIANGLKGFVLAALLGAVMSSLASMLNAASTIFTMDIYKEYINKDASQTGLVFIGRTCVLVFAVAACLIVPLLADPKFGGLFKFVQEFQGYISPGILGVFVIGLAFPRVPGFAGVLGLLVGPAFYHATKIYYPDMNYLNQMSITFIAVLVLMFLLTLLFPRKEKLLLPEKTEIDLRSSRSAAVFGCGVVFITCMLYYIFW